MTPPIPLLAEAKHLSIGLVVVLVQVFLLVNAPFIYGEYAPQITTVLSIYLLLLIAVLAMFRTTLPTMRTGGIGVRNFIIGFAVTAIVMAIIPSFLTEAATYEVVVLAIGFGLLHGFVKAYIEEVIFRWILPKTAKLGDVISNVLFGFFHLSVLVLAFGFTVYVVYAMVFLMVLGFIWAKVRDHVGLMGSTGSHFAYNLFALGLGGSVLGVVI